MVDFGKFLISLGLGLAVAGLFLSSGHLSWFGKLPGDVAIRKENFSFYFPITTCLVLSAFLTFLFWIFKNK